MGYTIKIGEAVVDWQPDFVGIDAKDERLAIAPAFGEPTDHTNARWPSYSGWADFLRVAGLTDLFFNQENVGSGELKIGDTWISPLMGQHPGFAPLNEAVRDFVREKLRAYREAHPDHRPEFPPLRPELAPRGVFARPEDYVQDRRYDGNLCSFIWLDFWIDWAVTNCDRPVLVNR